MDPYAVQHNNHEENKTPGRLLATLIWLALIAALIANIQPIFLGALAESFALRGQQVGFIGGLEMGGVCLASLSAFYWFPRVDLRRMAFFAVFVGVAGNLLTGWVTDYWQLLTVRFLTGFLGSGTLYALTLGLIGQIKNPERIIAIAIFCQVLSLVVGMTSVPVLLAHWQLPGVTVSLALLFSTGFVLLRFLPERAQGDTAMVTDQAEPIFLPAALLASLIVFSAGLGGVWAFMERIGSSSGFAMNDIGNALAVSGMVGGLGALAAAVLGTRLGRLLPIVVALGLQIATCALLAMRTDWYSYMVGVALFNFCWNLCLPYLMGAIAAADTSGRFMVLIPAAQAGGYALGPTLVALFLAGEVYAVAAWISMGIFVLCLLMVVPLLRRLSTD